jgi:hypothetical protein
MRSVLGRRKEPCWLTHLNEFFPQLMGQPIVESIDHRNPLRLWAPRSAKLEQAREQEAGSRHDHDSVCGANRTPRSAMPGERERVMRARRAGELRSHWPQQTNTSAPTCDPLATSVPMSLEPKLTSPAAHPIRAGRFPGSRQASARSADASRIARTMSGAGRSVGGVDGRRRRSAFLLGQVCDPFRSPD